MYEEIKEIVKSESEILQDETQLQLTRCHCGSSLVRIVKNPIIIEGKEVGCDYTIFCAKCGSHVFGFTDYYYCEYCPNEYNHLEKNRKQLSNKMNKVENQSSDELKDVEDLDTEFKVGMTVEVNKGKCIEIPTPKLYPYPRDNFPDVIDSSLSLITYINKKCTGVIKKINVTFQDDVGVVVEVKYHGLTYIFIPYNSLVPNPAKSMPDITMKGKDEKK